MTVVVFETHSISEDNETGRATGWRHSRLSEEGRRLAHELGIRRRHDALAAVFASDLRRARETAEIAFVGSGIPVFFDWRLRECNYGDHNGMASTELHRHRSAHVDTPFPNGESWTSACARVKTALDDIASRHANRRVLVIGHVATRWALDHYVNGRALFDLAAEDFAWQEGWEFDYSPRNTSGSM